MRDSSWKHAADWYDQIVDSKGHFYHREVIFPNALRLLSLQKNSSLLDLACGQGVLAGQIPQHVQYLGVDGAKSLLEKGKKHRDVEFICHNLMEDLTLNRTFSHAACILAYQNMPEPEKMLKNAHKHLNKQGKLLLVLNHPCFRIPRQSGWDIDEAKKLQFRWINRYATPLEIPISMNPGKGNKSVELWSYHFSLEKISQHLYNAGFSILLLEEWNSTKVSTGAKAKMENFARKEFPLFLAILAEKR